MADQGLVRETACAVVAKLKVGRGHAARSARRAGAADREVDGKVNALPTLCFDRARDPRQGADEKAGRRARPARGPADADQGPVRCRGRARPPRARRSTRTGSRRVPISWSSISNTMAAWSTPNRTRRNSAPAPTPSTKCSARRSTPGTFRDPPPAPPEAPRSRSPPAWPGSRMAPTWAARCAIRQASAASSGLRPSIGRVAHTPGFKVDRNLTVHGPMARNVEDLALLLDAMSGEASGRSAVAAAAAGHRSCRPRVPAEKPKRVAYSPDLGITPVDPEVARITRKAAMRFAEAGVDRRGSPSGPARGP